jgi:hypothetical protein
MSLNCIVRLESEFFEMPRIYLNKDNFWGTDYTYISDITPSEPSFMYQALHFIGA